MPRTYRRWVEKAEPAPNRGIEFQAGFTSVESVIELLQYAYASRRSRALGAWAAGHPVKPLFVCRDGGLGDILCTFPALEALAARQPGRPIAYVCHRSLVDIPRLCPAVTEVFESRCNDLVSRLLSRSWEVFSPRYRDESGIHSTGPAESLSREICRLGGVNPDTAPPLRARPPAMSSQAAAWLAGARSAGTRCVALHAGPTARVRCWPASHWAEFVRLGTAQRPDLKFVQVGPRAHFLVGSRHETSIPGALDGRGLPASDGLALISQCDAFVGVDSGLLHAAVAFGVPAIGLFGATEAARRLPAADAARAVSAVGTPCLGCHHRAPRQHWDDGCPFEVRCMSALQPEDVLRSLTRTLWPR